MVMRAYFFSFFAVILSGCKQHGQQPNLPPDQSVIFPEKVFFNGLEASPQIVYIAGALTGAHVGYPNNNTAITCYQDRMECVVSSVQQIGSNQIGRIDMPDFYDVKKWDKDTIVANGQVDVFNCRRLTITIVRTTQSALWVEAPISSSNPKCKDANKELLNWTIDDPPSLKAINAAAAGGAHK